MTHSALNQQAQRGLRQVAETNSANCDRERGNLQVRHVCLHGGGSQLEERRGGGGGAEGGRKRHKGPQHCSKRPPDPDLHPAAPCSSLNSLRPWVRTPHMCTERSPVSLHAPGEEGSDDPPPPPPPSPLGASFPSEHIGVTQASSPVDRASPVRRGEVGKAAVTASRMGRAGRGMEGAAPVCGRRWRGRRRAGPPPSTPPAAAPPPPLRPPSGPAALRCGGSGGQTCRTPVRQRHNCCINHERGPEPRPCKVLQKKHVRCGARCSWQHTSGPCSCWNLATATHALCPHRCSDD